jgi:multidrug efflux pump subunit AcrA (membrane-fusion protein)
MLAAMAMACRSSENDENPRGLVVVNATATGTVRRVLVNEGATVAENAVILEIAEQTQSQTAPPSQTDDSQARAQADNATALREIQAAEAEVERAAVEVQRVQPLVASGAAAQAQLDAARAGYQQAQEKLQRAKEKAQSAQRNFVLQQGRAQSQATAKPAERIVAVRVPSSGVVRVISVRAGERVAAGQPIATVAADKR